MTFNRHPLALGVLSPCSEDLHQSSREQCDIQAGFVLRGWRLVACRLQCETLRLDVDPEKVAASGVLMCGTQVITDLKEDVRRQEQVISYIILNALFRPRV